MDCFEAYNVQKKGEIKEFVLNEFCKGYSEVIDNCWNYSIFAQDPNISIFENEYNAGFIQAKIQGKVSIIASRNNCWKNMLICDTPQDRISIDIPEDAHSAVEEALVSNYKYLYIG